MSAKQVKKNRKEVRRVWKKNFGTGLEALSNITRKRPKWIPKNVWVLIYWPLFPKAYLPAIKKHID